MRWINTTWTLAVTLGLAATTFASPEPPAQSAGSSATKGFDFTLPGADGKPHTLSDHKGKWIVLEWVNFDCPFVKKHYRSGNMPQLQETYTKQGIVWIAICSSAEGKQGYYKDDALTQRLVQEQFKGTAYLMDPDGTAGKMFNAKTTPHLFVLNPQLELVYEGAIDSIRSVDPGDIPESTNYVVATLEAVSAGKPVPHAKTTPYGCSVKY